jgi:hypothetical protein
MKYRNNCVAEPHHVDPAPVDNFDAAPAPTLLYSKPKVFKEIKVNIRYGIHFFSSEIKIVVKTKK